MNCLYFISQKVKVGLYNYLMVFSMSTKDLSYLLDGDSSQGRGSE